MRAYKCLNKQEFSSGPYTLVPIRHEDRFEIMNWRNEQIYHLRQAEPLTNEQQDWYFENVIANLFEQENPNQILFSFLKNGECIGYGGLVHINWIDKHAEISFIMNTESETKLFHAGTKLSNNEVLTSGGRVFCATALGDNLKEAQAKAYNLVDKVSFEGAFFRKDIGFKGIK